MPVSKFSCPKCGKELKSAAPLPAGKKVKCPACAGVFTIGGGKAAGAAKPGAAPVRPAGAGKPSGAAPKKTMLAKAPLDDDPDGPPPRSKPTKDAIQAKKAAVPARPPARRDDEDEDEDDRPRRRRSDEDDEDTPRRAKRHVRHDDEDDYEERPRRRKRRADEDDDAESSGGFPWLLVGGGVLVLALAFTLTAFVWPGFMRGGGGKGPAGPAGPGGPAEVDILAFMPADAENLAGFNLAQARDDPGLAKLSDWTMQQVVKAIEGQGMPSSLVNALKDADEILVGGKTKELVLAVRSKSIDQTVALKEAGGERIAGKDYHRLARPKGGLLAFPTDRVLVMGMDYPDMAFEKVLATGGKQVALPAELRQHAQQGRAAVMWTAQVVQGEMKQQLQKLQARDLAMVPGLNPEQMLPALRNLRSVFLVLRKEGKGASIQVQLGCGSDQEASQLSQSASNFWNGFGKLSVQQLPLVFQLQGLKAPPLTNLINDLEKLAITNQGPLVTVSVALSEQTIRDMENFDPKGGGGPGPFPGPGPKPGPFPGPGPNQGTDTLKSFAVPEGGFAVKMPGTPRKQSQPAGPGLTMHSYVVETGDGAMMAAYADLPIPPNEPAAKIEDRLDGSRQGMLQNSRAVLVNETKLQLPGGHRGREFTANVSSPQGVLRARIYLVGSRLYQVMAIGKASFANSADATTFLQSFQLTK